MFCCRASPLLQGAHRLRPGGVASLATSGQGPYQPKGVKPCNFRSGALSA